MIEYIYGVDPGFTNIGLCRYHIPSEEFQYVQSLEVKTDHHKGVYAADDSFHKAQEIFRILNEQIHSDGILCFESMSFMRNAVSAAKVSMCLGVMAALSVAKDIPIVQLSPREVRKRLFPEVDTKQKISKAEVEERVLKLAPSAVLAMQILKSRREHSVDSMAVVLASLESDLVKTIKKAVSNG